jgi:hypothetical protein
VKTLNQLLTAGNDRIIFSCVAGSRAYGTQVPGSDEDVRGIYMVPSDAYLPIDREPVQLSDDRNNTVYYSLRRCIELLADANPNILDFCFRLRTTEHQNYWGWRKNRNDARWEQQEAGQLEHHPTSERMRSSCRRQAVSRYHACVGEQGRMKDQILAALRSIEAEAQVRVLLAVEISFSKSPRRCSRVCCRRAVIIGSLLPACQKSPTPTFSATDLKRHMTRPSRATGTWEEFIKQFSYVSQGARLF